MLARRKFYHTYLPALVAVFLTLTIVLHPEEAFKASLNGLAIWWNIVFPALLPFFIIAQLLIGLGVVHFLGVLLEPIMRPIFNVPGAGSFVMAMGLASGFPIGAVLTAELRQKNLCNKIEAERLVSFVNTADPLFMCGAVGVGMLHAPETGLIIVMAHYISTLTVGLLMRFYKAREDKNKNNNGRETKEGRKMFSRALNALIKARKEDNRPIGQLLGDSVMSSFNTLLLVGGFIMLFAVIIKMMDLLGIVGFLSSILSYILGFVGLHKPLASAFISGFFEIDLGCQMASTVNVPLEQKIIAISAIIAWSGLSVHAQVASIIGSTDISIIPYSAARLLHMLLAAVYSFLFLGPLKILFSKTTIPVFLNTIPRGTLPYWFERTIFIGGRFVLLFGMLLVISLVVYCLEYSTMKK
ncbi:MAG: sporulation integral membrane protein YlbJ [Dethiobacteria bacterium]|jgi:sporulation integral membrane protein YlbJ